MQNGDAVAPSREVSKAGLFLGFLKIGLTGFGGVGPWARHIIVEERRWLTDREFAEILGMGQVLPGPNVVNASVIIGNRFQGPFGALLCLLGIMAMPVVIVVLLAVVYEHLSSIPEVRAGLIGMAAASAGLVLGTALKMIRNIKPTPLSLGIVGLGFVSVAVLSWPLVPVVVGLVALALAATAMVRR